MEKVSFSKSDSAMDEQRIVRFAWTGSHPDRRGFDKLVRWAFDEIVKGVKRIQFDVGRSGIFLF